MPKFLDAPSWYDKTGTLRTIGGSVSFNSQAGYVDLPYTGFASGGAISSYYVLNSAGTSGSIVYSNGSYPMWLSAGSANSVLTGNGAGYAPSWTTLYGHYIFNDYVSSEERQSWTCFVISTSSTAYTASTLADYLEEQGFHWNEDTEYSIQPRLYPASGALCLSSSGNISSIVGIYVSKDTSVGNIRLGYFYRTKFSMGQANLLSSHFRDIVLPIVS